MTRLDSTQPRELQFGTSGRRGEIVHLTPLEIYINVLAELEYLQSRSGMRGLRARRRVLLSRSTCAPVRRGSAGAVVRAVARCRHAARESRADSDAGAGVLRLGRGPASIMVTGSHIPFDRNGYKLNTSRGELLKSHEAPIGEFVARVRERALCAALRGVAVRRARRFQSSSPAICRPKTTRRARPICAVTGTSSRNVARAASGILLYEHSAVGRDLLVGAPRARSAPRSCAGAAATSSFPSIRRISTPRSWP